ncbi:MAG: hypothetical protein K6L73_13840 [Cellvibrionaceae bacterium]
MEKKGRFTFTLMMCLLSVSINTDAWAETIDPLAPKPRDSKPRESMSRDSKAFNSQQLQKLAQPMNIGGEPPFMNKHCQQTKGFAKRMAKQGYWRDSTLYLHKDGYKAEDMTVHYGGSVENITLWKRGRLALYVNNKHHWQLVQSVKQQNKESGKVDEMICTVLSGTSFVEH